MRNSALFGFGSRQFAWLCAVTMALQCVSADEVLPIPADVIPSDAHGSAGYLDWGTGRLPLDGVSLHTGQASPAVDVSRPKYAVLMAELANWDADLEPDGWHCRVELRNQHDSPASVVSAQATFELRLCAPVYDVDRFNNLRPASIRWSQRLDVNETGTAMVKLPLRSTLPSYYIDDRGRVRLIGSRKSDFVQQHQVVNQFPDIHFAAGVGLAFSTVQPRPLSGVMVVRVSVPSVGVLEAIDPVLVSDPLLVDSNWLQR